MAFVFLPYVVERKPFVLDVPPDVFRLSLDFRIKTVVLRPAGARVALVGLLVQRQFHGLLR